MPFQYTRRVVSHRGRASASVTFSRAGQQFFLVAFPHLAKASHVSQEELLRRLHTTGDVRRGSGGSRGYPRGQRRRVIVHLRGRVTTSQSRWRVEGQSARGGSRGHSCCYRRRVLYRMRAPSLRVTSASYFRRASLAGLLKSHGHSKGLWCSGQRSSRTSAWGRRHGHGSRVRSVTRFCRQAYTKGRSTQDL